jgi:hypothetical protein
MLLILLLDHISFTTYEYKFPDDPKTECWVITTNFRVEDLRQSSHLSLRWKREPARIKWIDGRQTCNALNIKGWDVNTIIELYRPTIDSDLIRIENATKQTLWFWTPFGDGMIIHKHPKKFQV